MHSAKFIFMSVRVSRERPFVAPVRRSVCISSVPTGRAVCQILYWRLSVKPVGEIRIWFKSDKQRGETFNIFLVDSDTCTPIMFPV